MYRHEMLHEFELRLATQSYFSSSEIIEIIDPVSRLQDTLDNINTPFINYIAFINVCSV